MGKKFDNWSLSNTEAGLHLCKKGEQREQRVDRLTRTSSDYDKNERMGENTFWFLTLNKYTQTEQRELNQGSMISSLSHGCIVRMMKSRIN